jgi:hypothetical protein
MSFLLLLMTDSEITYYSRMHVGFCKTNKPQQGLRTPTCSTLVREHEHNFLLRHATDDEQWHCMTSMKPSYVCFSSYAGAFMHGFLFLTSRLNTLRETGAHQAQRSPALPPALTQIVAGKLYSSHDPGMIKA